MQIDLQPAGPVSSIPGSFAYTLFAENKRAELAPLRLSEAQIEPLLHMQWRGRALSYSALYPGGEEWTVGLADGTLVGHFLLHKSPRSWRLLDLAVTPSRRGQGIGTEVLRELIAKAAAAGLVLSLRVEKDNPAQRLYTRAGFIVVGSDDLSLAMECRPVAQTQTTAPSQPGQSDSLPGGSALPSAAVVDPILAFLRDIGLTVELAPVPATSFLPGIQLIPNGLRVDLDTLQFPGDLLHEAGHLAVMTPSARHAELPSTAEPAEEMAALAWSYAAALHLDIAPEVVFHPHGYRGQSAQLLAGFRAGHGVGAPMLGFLGLTTPFAQNAPSIFPEMLRWLRPGPTATNHDDNESAHTEFPSLQVQYA